MHKCQGTSQLLLLPGSSQSRTYKLQDQVAALTGLRVGPLAEPSALTAGATMFEGIDTSIVGLLRFAGRREEPALRTALVALQQAVIDARAASAARGAEAAVAPLAAGLRATRALRVDLPRLLGVPGARTLPPAPVASPASLAVMPPPARPTSVPRSTSVWPRRSASSRTRWWPPAAPALTRWPTTAW